MSGIYIPGMEMPTGTDVLTIAIDSHGKLYAIYLSDGELGINPLHKSVIPVPDHGRLIDGDALAKEIEYARFHHSHTDGLAARHHVAEYGHFLNALSEFPTIIPEDKEGE